MMSKKVGSASSPTNKWDGPEPDLKQEFPNQKTGQIDPAIVKEICDYTALQHRSDESIENWSRFDKATTFDENSDADLVRLALIDVVHQKQFQQKALAAGITDQPWNPIHPEYYTKYYNWMFGDEHKDVAPENPIQTANIMATYPTTPITVTQYGPSFSSKTMTRTVVENPTDIDLGFPALLPLGPEVDNVSWIASIDRIPAELFSRKICRRVYETLGKAVIITNLPQLYERKATELAQNKRDIAEGKEPTFTDVAIEGCEIKLRALQDKPRTADQIADQKQRRSAFKVAANPHDCHYPLYFWTIPYLANLSQDEVHQLQRDGTLPQQKQIPDPNDPEKTIVETAPEAPHPYGECFFRIGETDAGDSIRVRAKLYYQYLYTNKTDSPLYAFESNLFKTRLGSTIPKLFHPPTWLVADLVRDVLPIPKRPPFQWFLQGAKRSGTRMHTDPRATSAWNLSTSGMKRWVLFRGGVPSNVAKGNVVMTDAEYAYRQQVGNPQCVYWFEHILPRLRRFIFHREQKRRAVLLQLKSAGIYTFAPNGHAVCTCNCQGGINRRADRTERLSKAYAPVLQDIVSFLCDCQCLCGCKLAGMAQCGIDLNQIHIRMDPCTTADDSFGTAASLIPQSLLDLETKLEDEDYTQTDADGLTIQQQIDLLLAKHLATKDGPIRGSGSATVNWDELRDGYGFQEFIQHEHECIIVPSNIFHAVINITDTVAITENYANSSNTHMVYRSMRTHNRASTRRWMHNLKLQGSGEAENWNAGSTNDGRNVEEPMTPKQRAAWFRRWHELLEEVHQFDGARVLSPYRLSTREKNADSTTSTDDDSEITASESTTDPEPWISTDEDEM